MLTLDFEVFVHVVLVVVNRRHESLPKIDSDSSMHPAMNYSPQVQLKDYTQSKMQGSCVSNETGLL